jgi:predicted AAA+ superfamily ATPase
MYYCGNCRSFLQYNTAIIGKKESGKTTLLKNVIKHCYESDYNILLFDSSTNNRDKSLLVDTSFKYPNVFDILSPSKDKIHFDNINQDYYPYNIANKTYYSIYSFDVSKYLEESNNIDNLEEKKTIRMYYKQLVIQELIIMLPIVSKKRCVIIMDEIEFTPDMYDVIERYNSLDIKVIASFRNSQDLSTSDSLFDLQLSL